MTNPFITKLQHGADLTSQDCALLERLTARSRTVGSREDIIHEHERPTDVRLVMKGMAYRYKMLPSGSRQIMAFLVPGDFCDLHVGILGEMDHTIGTLTACQLVDIPREAVDDLECNHPRIARALRWSNLVDEATLREWLVNMGQRPADQQMAHLFCELYVRLQIVGETRGPQAYNLPLTQEELGDTLGLSAVHVNRVLQQLRAENLITFRGGVLTIPDVARLNAFAGFNPNYLHLRGRKPSGQA